MRDLPRTYKLIDVKELTQAPAGLERARVVIMGAVAVGLCVEDSRGSTTTTLVADGGAVFGCGAPLPPEPYDCLCGETDFETELSCEPGLDLDGRANAVVVGPASKTEGALAALGFFLYKYGWADRIRLTYDGQIWDVRVHRPSKADGRLCLTLSQPLGDNK